MTYVLLQSVTQLPMTVRVAYWLWGGNEAKMFNSVGSGEVVLKVVEERQGHFIFYIVLYFLKDTRGTMLRRRVHSLA